MKGLYLLLGLIGIVIILSLIVLIVTLFKKRGQIKFPPLPPLPYCPVWMYWEGPKSVIIKECETSIQHYVSQAGLKIIALRPETLSRYVLMPPPFFKLPPSQKSDVIRSALLFRYGGIWLDADLVGVDSFDILKQLFENNQFFAYYLPKQDSYMVCCLISKAKSLIAQKWFEKTQSLLRSPPKNHQRAYGIVSLLPILKAHKDAFMSLDGRRTVHSIPTNVYEEKISFEELKRYKMPYQPFIALFHSKFSEELKAMSRDELLESNLLPALLIKHWKEM